MKEKIKKCFKNLTAGEVNVMILLLVCLGCVLRGSWMDVVCLLSLALVWWMYHKQEKYIRLSDKTLAGELACYSKLKETLIDMEDSAIYYHLKWLLSQNDVHLCKKQISVGKYLERRKLLESKIEKMEKKIALRKQEKEKSLAG